MENENLAPDLPAIPGMRFAEEPNVTSESPTASFRSNNKDDYIVYVLHREPVVVRDKRPLRELIQRWLEGWNWLEVKGQKNNMEIMRANIAAHKAREGEFVQEDDVPAPAPWKNDMRDLMIFEGDENGVGAFAVIAGSIQGIAKPIHSYVPNG